MHHAGRANQAWAFTLIVAVVAYHHKQTAMGHMDILGCGTEFGNTDSLVY